MKIKRKNEDDEYAAYKYLGLAFQIPVGLLVFAFGCGILYNYLFPLSGDIKKDSLTGKYYVSDSNIPKEKRKRPREGDIHRRTIEGRLYELEDLGYQPKTEDCFGAKTPDEFYEKEGCPRIFYKIDEIFAADYFERSKE